MDRSDAGGSLSHYGVKGMKWGVTRANPSGGSSSRGASDDHKSAVAAQRKIDTAGTKALSNQELQGVITRMNLERQYSAMAAQNPTSMDRGMNSVQRVLKVGKTVEDVRRFLDTPTGKAVKTGLKGAFLAAKVAAAAQTGGASAAAGAAATAGAGLVLRRVNNR